MLFKPKILKITWRPKYTQNPSLQLYKGVFIRSEGEDEKKNTQKYIKNPPSSVVICKSSSPSVKSQIFHQIKNKVKLLSWQSWRKGLRITYFFLRFHKDCDICTNSNIILLFACYLPPLIVIFHERNLVAYKLKHLAGQFLSLIFSL